MITKISSVKRQVRMHHILKKKHKTDSEVYENKMMVQKTKNENNLI